MKHNVDLTRNREFRSPTERKIRRREACEECGEPIRIPWKEYCLRCERFFRKIGFFKPKCYVQLGYTKPSKGIRYSCRQQLNDPNDYTSNGRKILCRRQLGDTKYRKRVKIPCFRQLMNETF